MSLLGKKRLDSLGSNGGCFNIVLHSISVQSSAISNVTKGNAIRQLLSLQLISSLIIWVQAGRQEPAEGPTLPR